MPSLDEFTILLDNRSKPFYPGQTVTGKVIVSAPLEIKTQGLKIKCYGIAKVHWSETTTKQVGTGSNRRTERVTRHYTATENYFHYKIYVVGDGTRDTRIPPGQSEYPFNFVIPAAQLPCNYDGAHGKVIYEVSATIKRSWNFDKEVNEGLLMNTVLNLNPSVSEPVQRKDSTNLCCCCCESGPIGFEMTFPKTGFIPGENVSPSIKLFNECGRGNNWTSIALTQKAMFHAQSRTKTATKTVTEIKGPGVDPSDTSVWNPALKIPADVPPTKLGGCGIIDLQYFIHFELHLPGVSINLREEIPIMIGTVPNPLQTTLPVLMTNINSKTGAPILPAVPVARGGPGFVYPASWFGTPEPPLPEAPSAPPMPTLEVEEGICTEKKENE